MITASHNPAYDNGIKIIHNGNKTTPNQELMIEKYLEDKNLITTYIQNFTEDKSYLNKYFDDLNNQFNFISNYDVYLDSGNGSLSSYADDIISKFANVKGVIGNKPNGSNINKNVGSTHLDSLIQQKPKGLIGLAFDGDGDRLIAVDEKNKIITGDILLSIINNQLKLDSNMVFTKMLNPGIKEALNGFGINIIETDVGDKYIKQSLDENNFLVGGENSGHMIFKNLWPIGDGLFSAILLLKALSINNMTLHEASKKFKKWPEELINIKGISKEIFNNSSDVNKKIELLEKSIIMKGKLLIRPSGTEPVIRVYVSHKNRGVMNNYRNRVI